MKYLKALRIFWLTACFVSYLVNLIMTVMNDSYYNWLTIIILFVFAVAGPLSLIARIKNENNPQYLASSSKGPMIAGMIANGILICLIIFWAIADYPVSGNRFLGWYLLMVFACLYSLFNNLILYKNKESYTNASH